MAEVMMLTQDQCTHCTSLKMFLTYGLKDKYADRIETVHRQNEPEQFMALVRQFQVASTPVLISGDEVLRDCSPSKTIAFLKKHLGE